MEILLPSWIFCDLLGMDTPLDNWIFWKGVGVGDGGGGGGLVVGGRVTYTQVIFFYILFIK